MNVNLFFCLNELENTYNNLKIKIDFICVEQQWLQEQPAFLNQVFKHQDLCLLTLFQFNPSLKCPSNWIQLGQFKQLCPSTCECVTKLFYSQFSEELKVRSLTVDELVKKSLAYAISFKREIKQKLKNIKSHLGIQQESLKTIENKIKMGRDVHFQSRVANTDAPSVPKNQTASDENSHLPSQIKSKMKISSYSPTNQINRRLCYKEKEIEKLLEQKVPLDEIAKILDVSIEHCQRISSKLKTSKNLYHFKFKLV
jgi:hypothetical protein